MVNFSININITTAKSLQEMRAKLDSFFFLGNESQWDSQSEMLVNMETIKLGPGSGPAHPWEVISEFVHFHL